MHPANPLELEKSGLWITFDELNLGPHALPRLHEGAVPGGGHLAQNMTSALITQQRTSRLDQHFQHHHSGKYREGRKVVLKVLLCVGDILHHHDAALVLFQDFINESESHCGRVPQNPLPYMLKWHLISNICPRIVGFYS
jgi:hypothetical protein